MKKREPRYTAVEAKDERWQEDPKAARKAEQREKAQKELRNLWSFPINTMAAWAIEMAADKNGRLRVSDARDAEPSKKDKLNKDAALIFAELTEAARKLTRIFINDPDLIWQQTEF